MSSKVFEGLGVKICAAYLIIYYMIPFVLGLFFNYSYLDSYRGNPQFLYAVPAILVYFFIFVYIHKLVPEVITPLSRLRIRTFSRSYVNLAVTLLFLLLAIKFYQQYGLSYRHSGASLSESDSYVIVLSMLKTYFSMYLLLKIADISFGYNLNKVDILILVIGIAAFLFSGAASFDMIRILIILLLLIFVFINKNYFIKNAKKISILRALSFMILLVLGFLAILFLGLANKLGVEGAYAFLTKGGFIYFIKIPLARLSVHLYSLSYHLTYTIFDFDFQLQSITNILDNLAFRFGHIIGFDVPKPEISSTSRLNSLSIYLDPRARNGASPGMLGSIFFIPIFPFSIILSILYVSFVIRKVESIFNLNSKYSIITIIYILVCIQAFVDAQLDILNFIGVAGVQLFFVYLLWFDRPELRGIKKNEKS